MGRWHEQDAFWEAVAPFLFPDVRFGSTARQEVDQLVGLLGVGPGARVLDLCCGPGRHALELARRGFAVTAVDRTAAFLERGRRRADAEGLAVEWVHADMRGFRRGGAFDAAINFFTAFGIAEDEEADWRVVRNLCASLRPGGRLVMELAGKEVIARDFRERTWRVGPDGTSFLLEERRVRPGWVWLENRWVLFDAAGRREFDWLLRMYSGVELDALLRRAGFTAVDLYGSLAGTPYDREARRLVAVARK